MAADKTFLRPLTEADIDTIYSLTSDPRVAKYMRFSTHTSRKEAEELFYEYDQIRQFRLAYLSDRGRIPCGHCGAEAGGNEPDTRSMSVFLYPDCWNKGYSTEVVQHMKNAAAAEKSDVLKAYVVQDNAGSCRVLEKAAFPCTKSFIFLICPQASAFIPCSCKRAPPGAPPKTSSAIFHRLNWFCTFHLFLYYCPLFLTAHASLSLSGKQCSPSYQGLALPAHIRIHLPSLSIMKVVGKERMP